MKKSKSITLLSIGSLLAATTLSGCGPQSPPDNGGTFANIQECVAQYDKQTCDAAEKIARSEHLKNAPHFSSQNECVAQYGADQCQPATSYGGGNNVWLPMMTGMFIGSALSQPTPLYQGPISQRHGGSIPVYSSSPTYRNQQVGSYSPSTKANLNSGTTLSTRGGFGSFKPSTSFTSTYSRANPTSFGRSSMPSTSAAAKSFSARGGFGSSARSFSSFGG